MQKKMIGIWLEPELIHRFQMMLDRTYAKTGVRMSKAKYLEKWLEIIIGTLEEEENANTAKS